jgi:hypothetical protein
MLIGYAVGAATALPLLLVIWAILIKKIGDRHLGFRHIEQAFVLTGCYLVTIGVMYGLLRLYEGAVLR